MDAAFAATGALATAELEQGGNQSVNVDPAPGAVRTRRPAPCARRIPSIAESPNPRPGALLEKNGSKIRAHVAASIPTPVSCTSSTT